MPGEQDSSEKDLTRRLQGWRLDPAESYSDWEFEIIASDDIGRGGDDGSAAEGTSAVYHVHKYLLACIGDRKFRYFESMFRGGFAETSSTTQRCRIVLPTLAADAVPRMLNYAYFPVEPLQIDTQSATPLYFLSDYFGNDSMQNEVIGFVEKDLSVENCSDYYSQTKLLHKVAPTSDPILQMVIQFCAKNILSIKGTDHITKEADVRFWIMVLENVTVDNREISGHLNMLIAEICDRNIDDMTAAEFHELTKEDHLPFIDADFANKFLVLQSTVTQEGESEGGDDDNDNSKTSSGEYHLPLDWMSKLELISQEEDSEEEDEDYMLGEEEDDLDGEECDNYSGDLKDVPLYYDDDMEENELSELKQEKIYGQDYRVATYYDEGHDVDEQSDLALRCIKPLCIYWYYNSGDMEYFSKHPEMLCRLYHGTLAVARKQEITWQLKNQCLRDQLREALKKQN